MNKKTGMVALTFLSICLTAARLFSAEVKMLKVGSWATYKMESKTEMPKSLSGGGGGMQGMDPKMLAMLPPDQRAKIEAQMKSSGAGSGGASQMSAGGMMDMAGDMMKEMNFKIKYSIVGEEKRAGKPYIWLEIFFSGNLPDFDKIMVKIEPMLKSVPKDKQKETREKMAEAKKKMKEIPIATKDGKMKFVMKMLIEKPDISAGFDKIQSLKPIEIIKKEGDKPPVKLSQAEIEGFGKGESTEKRKDAHKEEFEHKAEFQSGPLGGDRAVGARMVADKVDQATKLGQAVGKIPGIQVVPGVGQAVAALQIANEATSIVSDIMNLQIKGSIETKGKAETESETETSTKLISKESQAIGMEKVQLAKLGAVQALHFQTKELRETTSKTKITKMDIDLQSKGNVGMEVDGGAQSKTFKVLKGVGKVAGKVSDPFGKKKKQQEEIQKNMQKGISKGVEGTEIGASMQYETVQDVWLSPQVPALGMAKLTASSQQKGGPQTSVGGGTMAAAYGQQQAAMQNQMMQSSQSQQPKSTTEFIVDQIGDAGAKSEL